jgi:chromosome segregation protein
MRLTTLILERYGHFTDRSLAFRRDAKLHVVFGPNEAGKSSALQAVTDLLFGIERTGKERRIRYDFQNDGREMAIGAEILGRDGGVIQVQRRKGPRKTLFGPGGEPIGEEALAPYLGGLTRDVFCRAFGLDAKSLREGADEMLKSEGEIGASLFAAASGLRGLAQLRRDLDAEAEEIYAPKGRSRQLNQLLERRESARKLIRSTELRAPEWKQLNDAIAAHTRRLDEIRDARAALAGEQARLKRLKRVAPLIHEIDMLAETADGFSDLPALPERVVAQLGTLLADLQAAQDECARAEADAARAEAEGEGIAVDAALLAHGQAVVDLFSETKAYAANLRDLPRIDLEAEDFRTALSELAIRIGLPDAAAVERQQPSEAAKARVAAAITQGRALAAEAARLERDLAAARDSLAALERQRIERGGLTDPTPLRQGLAALAPVLAEIDAAARLERENQAEARAIAAAASRLVPPLPASAAGLPEALGLPGAELVARFRQEAAALARTIERAADRQAGAALTLREIDARLQHRAGSRAVPSREALAAMRADRDRIWHGLRSALFGEAAVSGSALADAVLGLERATESADRLADAMAADAQRAAEHAADLERLRDETAREAEARAELAALAAQGAAQQAAWLAAWQPAGITPLPPAEMAAWLVKADALVERGEALAARRDEHGRLCARIENLRPALVGLAAGAGLAGLDSLEIGLIAGQLAARLDAVTAEWEAARDAESRLRATEEGVAQLAAQHARARDNLAPWRAAWDASVAELGLAPGAGLDEADAALAAWRHVPDIIAQRDNRGRRVAGMRRDIADYESRARAIIAILAEDLLGSPPDAAIAVLNKGVAAARVAEGRRDEVMKRRAAAARRLAERRDGLDRVTGQVAALAAAIGPDGGHDLDALHARLVQRRAVLDALAGKRADLATLGEHVAEATLRADLAEIATADVEARLAGLALDEASLDGASQETYAKRLDLERERAGLENGAGAEIATAEKRAAEVGLREAARQWAVLKLGAVLLATAIERHRTGQQDPLVARAGALFRQLTGGAFEGLAQDYDEADVPRLAGRRAEGPPIRLDGLSEGTRDQLYLALRLAYLEDYATRAEPAPFIGDDLFSTFDDARTVHGLEALAAIGDRIQPILFTHHRHVADLAAAHLGEQVDIVAL